MTAPSKTLTTNRETDMNKETTQRRKMLEEVAKFQKTMEDMRILRNISNDLKSYRRMIRTKRYD